MLVETNVRNGQHQGSGWLELATSDVSQTLCWLSHQCVLIAHIC